ncbi:SinI family restriction endonuclease, partial [bacterium]|nr:SinI family restriction endonuclease [bacterium]
KQEIEIGEKHHNLFMSAENIQGHLLEEYIASKIYKYGFLWCAGNILRAIDFCNKDGSIFLQVKNKYNTENSSSSNIREGTKIIKWYRLGVETKKGIKNPIYKWDELNNMINQNNNVHLSKCNMSENDYVKFLKEKSINNPKLITEL